MSSQILHCECSLVHTQQVFLITFIYAKTKAGERVPLWQDLRSLSFSTQLLWLVARDINVVGYAVEKKGGQMLSDSHLNPFNQCIFSCGLEDIKLVEGKWTWSDEEEGNGHYGLTRETSYK